jgi:hypothetical protein
VYNSTMSVAVQSTFALSSGNRFTVTVEHDGEITEHYTSDPTQEDLVEAQAHIPEALAEAGERGRERGEPEKEEDE